MRRIIPIILAAFMALQAEECRVMTGDEIRELHGDDVFEPVSGLSCDNGLFYRGTALIIFDFCVCWDAKNQVKEAMSGIGENYHIVIFRFDEYGIASSQESRNTKMNCSDLYKKCKKKIK